MTAGYVSGDLAKVRTTWLSCRYRGQQRTDALRADILSSCQALGLSRLSSKRPCTAGQAMKLLHNSGLQQSDPSDADFATIERQQKVFDGADMFSQSPKLRTDFTRSSRQPKLARETTDTA